MDNFGTFVPCDLTPEEQSEIGDLLSRAREIVKRVTESIYGEFRIREFRRELYHSSHPFNEKLTPEDWEILKQVHQIEGRIINSFVKMVAEIAQFQILRGIYQMDVDDLIQEGNEIVLLSMMGYNKESGVKLSTYLYNVVQRHFYDLSKRCAKEQANRVDMEDYDFAEEAEQEEHSDVESHLLEYAYTIERVNLTPLQRMVLDLVRSGHTSPISEASRRLINPKTGKNYSRYAASVALEEGRAKIIKVYRRMLFAKQNVA